MISTHLAVLKNVLEESGKQFDLLHAVDVLLLHGGHQLVVTTCLQFKDALKGQFKEKILSAS